MCYKNLNARYATSDYESRFYSTTTEVLRQRKSHDSKKTAIMREYSDWIVKFTAEVSATDLGGDENGKDGDGRQGGSASAHGIIAAPHDRLARRRGQSRRSGTQGEKRGRHATKIRPHGELRKNRYSSG